MIAEIVPEAYDAFGRKTVRPDWRRKGVQPTFPMGRYFSQPLTVKCESIRDIRQFLLGCRGVSDKELFGMDDYWQPPEEFERIRKGDCDDFALWAWRQLLALGYDARFVVGRHGQYGIGHAWVEFFKDGKWFLLEPRLSFVGDKMPRLSTVLHHPKMSVAWDGSKISFYSHEDRKYNPRLGRVAPLVIEWLRFYGWFWLKNFHRVPMAFYRMLRARLGRNRECSSK